MLRLFLIVGASLARDDRETVNIMNQVKRSGVVTKKRYGALVGWLKRVIPARASIPWSALARCLTLSW